jgi:hypothetical protein
MALMRAHDSVDEPVMDARAGLQEYRRRAGRAAVLGVVAFFVGSALIDPLGDLGGCVAVWGALAVVFGGGGLIRVARVQRLAARYGWRSREARFRIGMGGRQPALLLASDGVEPEAVLSVSTTVLRWNVLNDVQHLWVTGNPLSRFAAVATPELDHVVVVKRPWLPWWRHRLRDIANGS